MAELRDIKNSSATSGMNTDLEPQVLKEGMYINAINAKLNNQEGDIPFITNEPSNLRCLTLPLTVIGSVQLPSGKFAIFSTDNFQSEIGLFDEKTCTYERKVRASCLGFNTKFLIRGQGKVNFDGSESVYFTDNNNPRRVLNFDNIPYTFTELNDECKTKVFTTDLDCDSLLVDKKISYPVISVEFGTDGKLKNGSYQVSIAYLVNGQVATDWMGTTFPIKTFDHNPRGKSLEIKVSNLDSEFDGYALAVIHTVNGVTSVDKVGNYLIGDTGVVVTDVGLTATNNVSLTLDEIVNKRPTYGTAEDVVATSQYLLWTNPTIKDELNYQPDAMNITAKWVAYKLPKDYYRKGGSLVGYMRDEVYSFAIQWLYPTGDWSAAYHIPGQTPQSKFVKRVSGQDVYEKSSVACENEDLPYYFEVNNTAKLTQKFQAPTSFCDPVKIAEGIMGYWQSSENYPQNDIFGDYKCTPIRHHKFPDCNIINHHDADGPIILGVRFENIKPPEDVVGYRIVRGDRTGNRSVIAKGLLFNVGNYTDNGENWMYPNYPYNDLRSDPFLSSTQTRFNGSELNYNPIGNFSNNKFTFHSPSTALNKPLLGTELKIESEEIGQVTGRFQEVYKHPKYKMITNFSYGIAAAIALGSATLAIKGKKCVTSGTQPGGVDGAPRPFSYSTECETELMGKIGTPIGTIPIPNIAGIAIAFGYYMALGLQTVVNLIKGLSSYEQFAYQYNSHGLYNNSIGSRSGNKRRRINYGQYLIPGNQDINGVKMNNFNRESSVYLELNSGISNPINRDVTRNTISGFGLCDNRSGLVQTTASSYYGSIKRKVPNQYGQLNAIRYLDTGVLNQISDSEFLTSEEIFGGDTYIGRFTEKRKLTYFLLWPFDVPDGWEWDYRRYANIPFPRFWIDGTDFDFSDMARLKTPSSKHNLDCYRRGKGLLTVKDRYMYLFNSGIIDYYAESEYCPDYRDWDDTIEGRHYDFHSYTNLQELFRSDKIQFDNRFIFDKVFLKQLNENFIKKQDPDFDPDKDFTRYKNRIIYSLAAQQEQIRDNWLIYPGLNYFDFSTENGNLVTVGNFDRDRLIFLFDRSGPYTTLGIDTLQTDGGTKVLIGDGGVFAQRPQNLTYTKYAYGSCENKNYLPTHAGGFYPSQEQGRIFKFNGQSIDDITRNGKYWWFREHLPSKLLKDYPEFIHKDNPLVGVGVISVFDNSDEIYYLTKIDYKVKDEWKDVVTYNAAEDQWRARGVRISFKDPLIFEDASFTVSYDIKQDLWISYHDWHPESTIQTEKHFITLKDHSFWKHNELTNSYCNFYGQDYSFEVEIPWNSGQQTSTLSSIEYSLEAFRWINRTDKYHVKNENFNELTVYNTEQCSGLVKLELKPRTMISPFPIFAHNSVTAEYAKVEQKYRFNYLFDVTKDRNNGLPLMKYQANGYRKYVNKVAVSYNKDSKKPFRHNYGSIILRRNVSGDLNFKFKWINEKSIVSPR